MKAVIWIIGLLSFSSCPAFAQEHDSLTTNSQESVVHSLKEFLVKGHFHGHVRNHFMATINHGELTDYWSNATGGAIHYESAAWKGFRFGLAGIFTYQTASSDLNVVDPISGKTAKWERELYDLARPQEKRDLDRLEELWVQYAFRHLSIRVGKQNINEGPLLLEQDGRMKPFVYRGIWMEFGPTEHQQWILGGIDKVSPRGFTEWYSIDEAIGLTGQGCAPDGSTPDYHATANTRGIAVLGFKQGISDQLEFSYWNYWFDRLFDLHWLQLDAEGEQWFWGLQAVTQLPLSHQNSLHYSERYIQPEEQTYVVSSQVGRALGDYLKISAICWHNPGKGRFLFPKELGREAFYASQSRARTDGLGQASIYAVRVEFVTEAIAHQTIHGDVRLSRIETAPMNQYADNKFSVPSHFQLLAKASTKPHGFLEGAEFSILYVLKATEESSGLALADQFNKTNLHHLSVVSNINF